MEKAATDPALAYAWALTGWYALTALMADIFLSYAHEDRASAERIARVLAGRGYNVWWDPDIPAGPSFTQVIEQALTSAKCVLVLWSAASVASSWVQDEAREGQERGVLVAARLADVKPPLGFRGHQLADLAAWDGGADDREFRRLLRGIEAHVPPPNQPAQEPSPLPQPPVRSPHEAPVSGEADVPARTVVPPEVIEAGEIAEPTESLSAGPTSVRAVNSTARDPIAPVTPSARPLERGTPPTESTASGWPHSDGPDASPAKDLSPSQPARGAIATLFGGLNWLVVVAVVLVSGMMVLLRDESPGPASSGAAAPSDSAPQIIRTLPAGVTPVGVSLAAPPHFRGDAWQLPDQPLLGFIEVPAGQFTMGSGRQDSASDDEMPQHEVTLPAFFIGKYEVTVAQYMACVDDGGCRPGDRRAVEGDGDLPVRWVSWHEALAYCAWLQAKLAAWTGTPGPIAAALAGRRDGVAWRITLPSEAEWERAARGTDARIYPWGTGIDRSRARYTAVSPAPVGTRPAGASSVGAMDMAGNISEWTRSIFDKYPYAPDDGRERLDAPDFALRVVRGGSFIDPGSFLRAAARRYRSRPVDRTGSIGFRVVSSRLRP